jgi:hypothetical protein
MSRPKDTGKSKRLIWRISDRAPLGEWVDPTLPAKPPKQEPPEEDLPEVSSGRWMRSSFDLLNGVDVDDSPNTVPDELFDELFPSPRHDPKSPRR